MSEGKKKWTVSFNAPVVLIFSLIALAALILGYCTGGLTTGLLFSVYRSSLLDPLTYVRMIGHVFGHANVGHLVGNLMIILLLGPFVEKRYGSGRTVIVILVTAIVTGLVHFIFVPNTALLGASGVAFAFIILSSLAEFKRHEIPVTFLLVAALYLGQQIVGLFQQDSVSQLTHILGGVVGGFFGFIWKEKK
jgi:GlpG protein